MYYFDKPILLTTADAILVPVGCNGKIPQNSLQARIGSLLGKEYENDYWDNLKKKFLVPSEPTIFMHENINIFPFVINFPVRDKFGRGLWLSEIVKGFQDLPVIVRNTPIRTIAVSRVTDEYAWGVQEDVLNKIEELIGVKDSMEFWIYPPTDEDRKDVKHISEMAADNIVGAAMKGWMGV